VTGGIFVYSDNPRLAAELAALAGTLDQSVTAVSIGSAPGGEAVAGASRTLRLRSADPIVENYAAPLAAILRERGARAFFTGDTVRGRDLAARVAALCDAGMISAATNVVADGAGFAARRMVYGGKLVEDVRTDGFTVLTLASGSSEAVADSSEPGPVEDVDVSTDAVVELVAREDAARGGSDLANARVVVAAGLGVADRADLALFEELAGRLGGAVGCSRGVCEERGWFDQFIGISGLQLSPDLYLGAAVSGQVQHLFGVRAAKVIAAVNHAKDAPVFRNADYGILGDYKKVLPLLVEALT
jgi:electron transfer flavoprotein alpha subunit